MQVSSEHTGLKVNVCGTSTLKKKMYNELIRKQGRFHEVYILVT